MKKVYVLILFFSISLSAQLQWRPLTSIVEDVDTSRFDDVFFLNENLGWAANGAHAGIYKTTDGGATWTTQVTEQSLGANYYFRNVEFLNENIGFVGTLNGVFLKTIDGGDNWTVVSNFPTNPQAICGLDAVGTATVYGCGAYFSPAYIIKSSDSGSTWEYIDMSAYATALVEILFVDENIGYASGSTSTGAVVLKTLDGGSTWSAVYNSTIAGEYVWKLQILQSNPNVIFGSVESVEPFQGKLIKSTDNGLNWVSKEVPDYLIQGVGFLTENHGFMGGYHTNILETFDSGDTWNDIGVGLYLNRIFIVNNNLAYGAGATVYKFSDTTLNTKNFVEKSITPLKALILPNPVKDKLNVAIEFKESDHLVIDLYDAAGHRLKELQKDNIKNAGTKTYSFDFPYAAGVYFLDIHTNMIRQSLKFVKQ